MNNYHIYEEIGKGDFSVVYKGRKKKTIEYMAVKSLEKSRRQKLQNEVKLLSDLHHANVLRFYYWYETRNHLWLITEYCAGGDLMQLIEQDKTISEATVRSFGRDLAAALQYLHSRGIIYCDLKPHNVLINEYGALKLSDFGLARRIVDLIPAAAALGGEGKKGTPCYMAPELYQEDGVYSFQSDLWSLGCLLFELATGKPPFESESFTEVVNMIMKRDVPIVEKFSQQFNDLVQRLLAKEPTKRIAWRELLVHPFWQSKISALAIPPQPHFEAWAAKAARESEEALAPRSPKPLSQQQQQQQTSKAESGGPLAEKLLRQAGANQTPANGKEVNILRLSLNVKKNLAAAKDETSGYAESKKENDVRLANRNQEIDLGSGTGSSGAASSSYYAYDENTRTRDEELYGEEAPDGQAVEEEAPEEAQTQKAAQNLQQTTGGSKGAATQALLGGARAATGAQNKTLGTAASKTGGNGTGNGPVVKVRELAQAPEEIALVQTPGSQRPGEGYMTPVAKIKTVPLEQLMTHSSDNAVKPIIGNKEIEKLPETTFTREALPFEAMSCEEVIAGIEGPAVEAHFEALYAALVTSNTDKQNVLNYFETIVQHSSVANRLINSQFMTLLIKLLKQFKIASLKARIASIIGLLIRHATVIENELSSLGIPNVMIEVMRAEKNEKVRRRCIAAMGEYLFYGATQIDEDPGNVVWELTNLSYQHLLKLLRGGAAEDDIVKFYAVKTIENITAQSVQTGGKFSNQEMAAAVLQLFLSSAKFPALRVCAAICLTHMTVLVHTLTDFVLERVREQLPELLAEQQPRVQQALLTILNMHILNKAEAATATTHFRTFLPSVVALLDSAHVVVRGKAVLCVLLLLKVQPPLLQQLAEQTKFFQTLLEKLQRDQYKYVQQCLFHLMELLEELLPYILQVIADDLQTAATQVLASASPLSHSGGYAELEAQQSRLRGFLSVLTHYLAAPSLRAKIYSHNYLELTFSFLDTAERVRDDGVKTALFVVYEHIVKNEKLLGNNHDFFIKNILPKLCEKFLHDTHVDVRFNCLKLFIDILATVMTDQHIYDEKKVFGKIINDFLLKSVLPNLQRLLLQESDPIPGYTLKLVNLLVEKSRLFVASLLSSKQLLSTIFDDFFTLEHHLFTKNTLEIVSHLTGAPEMPLEDVLVLLPKTLAIFVAHDRAQKEWAFEDLLEILTSTLCKTLTQRLHAPLPENVHQLAAVATASTINVQKDLQHLVPILDQVDLIVKLLSSSDYATQDAVLRLLQYLYYTVARAGGSAALKLLASPTSTIPQPFKVEYLPIFAQAILQSDSLTQLRQLAKDLAWGVQLCPVRYALSAQGSPAVVKGAETLAQFGIKTANGSAQQQQQQQQKDQVAQALEKLLTMEDARIAQHARDIVKIISTQA